MQTIKWLLFHEPAELFIRTAEHFEEEINRLTNNQFKFDIMLLDDYEREYNNGNPVDMISEIQSNRVQMSQMYTGSLAFSKVNDYHALALPFLFKDHDHATRVFEGEVGAELLDQLKSKLNIKGLSFTYSGGYKCMAVDRPIKQLDDFKNLTYRRQRSGVFTDIFNALGATPVTDGTQNINQTTLPRYKVDSLDSQRWCTNTGHSMYLTSIIMSDQMWSGFDETTQQHFKTAARITADAERKQSVADAVSIETDDKKRAEAGIDAVLYLDEADQTKLRSKLEPIIERWKPYFTPGLVDRIQSA